MANVPGTQALYSQDTTQTQRTPETQVTPQTPGGTGFTIPVHCGLLTLISDLNKFHNDIKLAARDVATAAGCVLLSDPVEEITDQLQQLQDKLTNLPVLKILANTQTHKDNASQMHTENKNLKAHVKDLMRELAEAKQTLAALTGEEAQKEMTHDECLKSLD